MHKDSVRIERSRVTLAKPEDGSPAYGVCLDSVQVEGVFQVSDEQPSGSQAGSPEAVQAVTRPSRLVEVNITSRRVVITKGRP